jgi:hypothetical protein
LQHQKTHAHHCADFIPVRVFLLGYLMLKKPLL